MSFWDNLAGGIADGAVRGADLGMKIKAQQLDSDLAVNRDKRAQAEAGRADERMSWDRGDRQSLETIAAAEVGGIPQPSLAEKIDAAPAPAAMPAPSAEAPTQAAPARSAIPTGPAPAAAPAGNDYDSRIAAIEGLTRDGKVSARVAASRIAALRKEKDDAAKSALDMDYKRQQISESRTRQDVARQGLTEAQFKQNQMEASRLYDSAHAKVSQLKDDAMSVSDPSVQAFVSGALDDYKRMHDKIDDGKTAEIIRGKDGVSVRLLDDKSGEVIEDFPIRTVADLKQIDTITRQIAKGEGAAKYAAASLADRVAADMSSTMERGLKADAELSARRSEGMPKVLDTMREIVDADMETRLSPEYKQRVQQVAQEAELLFGDVVAPVVDMPIMDPTTGEQAKDDNGKPLTRKVKQNQILLLAAQNEPNTKIRMPSGKTIEAEALIAETLKDAPGLIREAGGDPTVVGTMMFQQLIQGGVEEQAAMVLAQRAVAQLEPAMTQALKPVATPAAIKMPAPRGTPSAIPMQ